MISNMKNTKQDEHDRICLNKSNRSSCESSKRSIYGYNNISEGQEGDVRR